MVKQREDSVPAVSHAHVLEFLAELMNITQTATTPETSEQTVQTHYDELRPWVLPTDASSAPRAVFALLAECMTIEDTDHITARFSPEREAVFRAWLRRQGVMIETAKALNPGWTQ